MTEEIQVSTSTSRGIFTLPELQEYLSAPREMKVDRLGERLWSVTDSIRRTIFVEGDEGVVAFDTFDTPGAAESYREAIRRTVEGKDITGIVYTHDHLDRSGFGANLAPEAETIAHEMAAVVIGLRQIGGQLPVKRVVRGERETVTCAGATFDLIYPGPTHGSGNVAAYFPEERLLFMADTIEPAARYSTFPDYALRNFANCMRRLLALDFETFVPGRFNVTSRAAFEEGLRFFEDLDTAVQEGWSQCTSLTPVNFNSFVSDVVSKMQQKYGHLDGFSDHISWSAIRWLHLYVTGPWDIADRTYVDPLPITERSDAVASIIDKMARYAARCAELQR
jgi:glyoxylase-like metal-dependent hydrolase (beta-lactamase superfamily II)